MKKYKWFPTAKFYSVMIHGAACFTFLFLITVVFFVQWYVNILFIILLVLFLIIFSVADKKIYPIFIKIGKKDVKIYYFLFNKKRLVKEEVKIRLTEVAYLFGLYHTGDYIKVSQKYKNLKIKNYLAFVLYADEVFIDKLYLRDNINSVENLQEYVDYSWETMREEKYIILEGSYPNYRFLRQFFGTDKFYKQQNELEYNTVLEYEKMLQQENKDFYKKI